MAKIIPLKLNKNKPDTVGRENAPTVAERVAALRLRLDTIASFVEQQAAAEQMPSFVVFETALQTELDAVGRAAVELFLTLGEECVAAASKDGVQFGDRFQRS
jgi:hypothetical protein